MEVSLIIAIVVMCAIITGLVLWLRKQASLINAYEDKYSKIIDVDSEVERRSKEKTRIERDIEELRSSYRDKKAVFNRLVEESAIYDEDIQLAELGFYRSHFDFDTSERYKEEITSVKSKQKEMISSKTAIYGTTEWTVEGSKAKGRTMTNRGIRLAARAFNNECDATISNTRWNNADRMEKRIQKAFDAINKLNESNAIIISDSYLKLKLDELRLAHEYKEKKQREKEEQAEIRSQMREEAKLERELEKAVQKEEKYLKLLAKAKAEADQATGEEFQQLQRQIESLDKELKEAHSKSERAKSMAEQTRMGHIYIISNLGSFGENVYKIGMTRRLEPMDRVKELGDASVPFVFDVHAMIYSDDAPALEKALHHSFNLNRLNLVNSRKEFFNVRLEEIEGEAKKISPDAEFIETAEAREYRESTAIREQRAEQAQRVDARNELPDEI